MATSNQFLNDWVKNAYSMEMGLVSVLERQVKEVEVDQILAKGIDRHLQATRHHADLLRSCLQRMGENVSGIQPRDPLDALHRQVDGGGPDGILRTELIDFVTESYEVASYKALATLAKQIGDDETARVCAEILQDESSMVSALDRAVPGLGQGVVPGRVDQDNVRIARESFDALNAHDLDRWIRLTTDDYYSDAPGTMEPMDRQQNRDYLANFMSAFRDLHFQVLRTIAQDNHVVMDWEATGTHTGPLQRPDGRIIAQTNRRVKEFGSTTFECQNGKIRRVWVYFDLAALMVQLGTDIKA